METWGLVALFVGATVFVGIAFAVLYPPWPPVESRQRHRPGKRRRPRGVVLTADEYATAQDPRMPPLEIPYRSPYGDGRRAPERPGVGRHRAEDWDQDTIYLPWYEHPGTTGEQPLYPDYDR